MFGVINHKLLLAVCGNICFCTAFLNSQKLSHCNQLRLSSRFITTQFISEKSSKSIDVNFLIRSEIHMKMVNMVNKKKCLILSGDGRLGIFNLNFCFLKRNESKMPLIVISGVPCSGKSTRSLELKQFFEEHGKEVHIVSENEQIKKAGFQKNAFYADSNKEKHIRGLLKSEMLKLISPTNVVILDALNYIKGYRYELFCGTKANRSTQCTVHAEINRDEAWTFNLNRENEEDKYDRPTFDALLMRYEEPDGRNRWDAPLFMIFPEQPLDKDAIYSGLFKKPPPKPNMSTQNPPLSSTNFLYDIDKITKNIVDNLIKEKSKGATGVINIPDYEDLCIDVSNISVPQLNILRRQYLTYSKMHAPDPKDVPNLFVKYLTASLK